MKTNYFFSIATAVLICSALTSCEEKKTTDVQTKGLEVPSQLISVDQSIVMKKEYEQNIASLIRKSKMEGQYDPTQFAYIELDSLKKYIAFLDQVAKLNDKKISGIRIYYGAYPENQKGSTNFENPGRETFFLAPTIAQNASGNMSEDQKKYRYLQNVPFSIAAKDPNNKFVGDFTPINELLFSKDVRVNIKTASLESSTQNGNPSTNGSENTSVILNDLNICPPPRQ